MDANFQKGDRQIVFRKEKACFHTGLKISISLDNISFRTASAY